MIDLSVKGKNLGSIILSGYVLFSLLVFILNLIISYGLCPGFLKGGDLDPCQNQILYFSIGPIVVLFNSIIYFLADAVKDLGLLNYAFHIASIGSDLVVYASSIIWLVLLGAILYAGGSTISKFTPPIRRQALGTIISFVVFTALACSVLLRVVNF